MTTYLCDLCGARMRPEELWRLDLPLAGYEVRDLCPRCQRRVHDFVDGRNGERRREEQP